MVQVAPRHTIPAHWDRPGFMPVVQSGGRDFGKNFERDTLCHASSNSVSLTSVLHLGHRDELHDELTESTRQRVDGF